jgi:hypothetical protein
MLPSRAVSVLVYCQLRRRRHGRAAFGGALGDASWSTGLSAPIARQYRPFVGESLVSLTLAAFGIISVSH